MTHPKVDFAGVERKGPVACEGDALEGEPVHGELQENKVSSSR
jgi:hypothetical protein